MGCAAVERVRQEATTVVQNLPEAHASWQLWRNARFRAAIRKIDESLQAIDVELLTETQLEFLWDAALLVRDAIRIHTSSLGTAPRDEVDRRYLREVATRLAQAAEALQRGESPNPKFRRSDDERLDAFGKGLHRANLA